MVGLTGSSTDDPMITAAQKATSRWRDHWQGICRLTPPEVWSRLGLYKNAHRYALVAELLLSKHDQIDVAFLLQPGCEDKLERLQHLAGGDGDD